MFWIHMEWKYSIQTYFIENQLELHQGLFGENKVVELRALRNKIQSEISNFCLIMSN